MTPKNDDVVSKSAKKKAKGDSKEEDIEDETARLLTEDPMDWMLKNEHVTGMLSVSDVACSINSFHIRSKIRENISIRNI